MRPGVGPLPLLSFKFRAYWEFSRRLHPLLHANPRRFAREVHTYNTLGFASSLFKQYTTIFFSVFELVVSPRRAPVPRIARLLFCLLMPPKNHYPNFSDIILSGTPFRAIASPAGFRTGVNEPRVTERKGTDGQRGGSCFYYDGMRVRTKGCWE